jgi:hypothetical protein
MFGIDRVILQVVGVLLLLFALIAGYYWWKSGIEKEALQEWNKKQIELVQEENQKTIEKLKLINEDQEKLNKELKLENEKLTKKLSRVRSHIRSPEVSRKYYGTQSSDILKHVFKELSR